MATARAMVRGWSEKQGVRPGQADDIMLAVSEAVANAVLHAYPDREDGAVDLTARAERDDLVLEVCDTGVGPNVRSRHAGLGLGLVVIDRLSHSATVEDAHPGTHVTMRFRLVSD